MASFAPLETLTSNRTLTQPRVGHPTVGRSRKVTGASVATIRTRHTIQPFIQFIHCSCIPHASQLLLMHKIHMTFTTLLPNLGKTPVSANTDPTLMAIEPATPMTVKLGSMNFELITWYPKLM